MSLFDPGGHRLYLNAQERERFLKAAQEEDPQQQVFCRVLHYTGCRPSEALALTPARILFDERSIVFLTLKKRATDRQGRPRKPHFRSVPVPEQLLNEVDLTFRVRRRTRNQRERDKLLWTMSRPTAWRMVKRVMARGGIEGPQATSKGLRHGFGIALAQARTPATVIRDVLGHYDTKTTEIYTKAVGEEMRSFVEETW